ncbi:MAG TPA: hypothetical protein DCL60_02665 [Armatimonadetes bacterium]|nr:hypothetical protein [Armatimonadota bacterium]
MLIELPQYIDRLDKSAIIMYWEYTATKPSVSWFKWKGRHYFGEDVEDIPQEIAEIYKPYWDGGGFPHSFRAFSYTKFFKDHGFDVICAPIGDQAQALDNITEFSLNAAENDCLGSIVTAWPLFPGYQTAVSFAAAAEQSWNPGRRSEDFAGRINHRYLCIEGTQLAGWSNLWGKGATAGREKNTTDYDWEAECLLAMAARGGNLLQGLH